MSAVAPEAPVVGVSLVLLNEIRQTVESIGRQEDILTRLRASYSGLSFTQCSEDDIPARLQAVVPGIGFDLFLMDASNHCITLTNDASRASGVVIAWREDESAS